jgi:predicted GIY-YIG superfamily endonuclease
VVDHDDSWWAYLLLSANSRKTYVGVSSNVVRRCVCVCLSRVAATV